MFPRPIIIAACLLLAACGGEQDNVAATFAPKSAQLPVPDASNAKPTQADPGFAELLARANAAFAANRLLSPAGDNALELFLAARDLQPDHSSPQEALVELFPATTAAVTSAIARKDLTEAHRLLGLLDRAMPRSLAARQLHLQITAVEQAEEHALSLARGTEANRASRIDDDALAPVFAAKEPAPMASRQDAIKVAPQNNSASTVPATTIQNVAATTTSTRPSSNPTPAPAPAKVAMTEPVALSQATPDYPALAKQRRLHGWVELEFIVGLDGRAQQVKVVDAQPRGVFDLAAQRALVRWRFKPGERNGTPAPTRTRTRMTFKLS